MSENPVAGRVVLIAGATSASGLAAARALAEAGARVVAVGRDEDRLAELAQAVRGIRVQVADLTDEAAVHALHDRVGAVDGVLHLVGGWRGGGGLAGQSEADYRFLELSFTALRVVSREFDADLRAADRARLAIVSSTAVDKPLAGGANYAAVKAASEAWTRAVAQGFAKAARDAGAPLTAAATVFRVKSLEGLEAELAARFTALWAEDAASVNGTIITL
ncbi:SDR family NAD(P)-dependent oxidoreductase [Microbacterium sp. NPDC064584]|uniref:SDR family NAD(P)-dependent oxidoreductase n=1 Tax=Microbacterium sp. NPDC064584 TaxID=3155817 RepID=UPI00343E08DF